MAAGRSPMKLAMVANSSAGRRLEREQAPVLGREAGVAAKQDVTGGTLEIEIEQTDREAPTREEQGADDRAGALPDTALAARDGQDPAHLGEPQGDARVTWIDHGPAPGAARSSTSMVLIETPRPATTSKSALRQRGQRRYACAASGSR